MRPALPSWPPRSPTTSSAAPPATASTRTSLRRAMAASGSRRCRSPTTRASSPASSGRSTGTAATTRSRCGSPKPGPAIGAGPAPRWPRSCARGSATRGSRQRSSTRCATTRSSRSAWPTRGSRGYIPRSRHGGHANAAGSVGRMSLRRCLPLLAFLVLAAPASASVPASFYTPPKALPKAPGKPIHTLSVQGGNLPTGKSMVVMYSSKAPDGKIVPVTGIMTVPKGKAPKGGFPVVLWAHGTTGIADSCAPSRYAGDAATNDYVKNFRAEASEWTKDGYAVVQTDYQGLGVPGMHPYLIGISEGRSVIDLVRAAHAINPRVGKRWAAVGHSQGGHATLWAAALGPKYAPSLRMMGAVPLAPASHIGEQAAAIDKVQGNPFGGLPA